MNKNEINELLSWITRYSKHNQEGFYYDDLINVFGLKKELLDNLIKTKQLVRKNDLIYPSIYSIALASNQKTEQQSIVLASDRLVELIKLSNQQYSKSLGFHLHCKIALLSILLEGKNIEALPSFLIEDFILVLFLMSISLL